MNKGKQLEYKNMNIDFEYQVDFFDNVEILRYKVDGWENISLDQKKIIYCLCEAALHGRDIIFDQNNKYNLAVRRILESIYSNYHGDKTNVEYRALIVYLKKVWFSNGIHHRYSAEKFQPNFSECFFKKAVLALENSLIPKRNGQSTNDFLKEIIPIIFDSTVYAKKINQDCNADVILMSANNYYGEGITQFEVEQFYKKFKNTNTDLCCPISYGLNTRLIKKKTILIEEEYKIGSLYSSAIAKIIFWLKKACLYVKNKQQNKVIELLIEFYQTGNLHKYNEYVVNWIQDTESLVDFVNGFTETYGDALGIKGSWESIVNFQDLKSTKLSQLLSNNAQWFEDNSPVSPCFKKTKVKGVIAKSVTACILGGDCYPSTPVGINLPNSNWIRKNYGSKSVNITNITSVYNKVAGKNGFIDEFVYGEKEKNFIIQYGNKVNNLHIDLHECIGHASGTLVDGVTELSLKTYASTIEEARADLFALYFVSDIKIIELCLLPNVEAYKAEYYFYLMDGAITQLARIELGKNIEEAHMRSRALIAYYLLDTVGNGVVEFFQKNQKTYLVIYDYIKLRKLIGDLLCEIQRIKSEGDLIKAKYLIEKYAVRIDQNLHQEVIKRYKYLNIAPYKGFVNPVYKPVYNKKGDIIDVKISYLENYSQQMLRYSQEYSNMSTYNDKN